MSLPPTKFPNAVSFDLTDPAELFLSGVIQQFHQEQRRLYRVLAARRVEVAEGGMRHRLVVQAARYQALRVRARPEWQVLLWDIDGPGVRFLMRPTRAAMMAAFHTL